MGWFNWDSKGRRGHALPWRRKEGKQRASNKKKTSQKTEIKEGRPREKKRKEKPGETVVVRITGMGRTG